MYVKGGKRYRNKMPRKSNPTQKLLNEIKKFVIDCYKSNLSAIVIFGSVGRGKLYGTSDIDLLLILKKTKQSVGERMDDFFEKITKKIKSTDTYMNAYKANYPHKIQPIVLTEDELKSKPPIVLDFVTDAQILVDRNNFFENFIAELKAKLKQIGAKKVKISEERWYWILKPDIKRGEIVEI
jgi:hypothetical protein